MDRFKTILEREIKLVRELNYYQNRINSFQNKAEKIKVKLEKFRAMRKNKKR